MSAAIAKVSSGEIKAKRPKLIAAKVEVIPPQTNRASNGIDAQELDLVIEKITKLDRAFVKSAYELGQALLDCHDRALWRNRQEAGVQKYTTWAQFVDAELTLSRQHSYVLMQIASTFERGEIEDPRLGAAKLILIQRVKDPKQRAVLIDETRVNRLSTKALKAKVEEIVPSARERKSLLKTKDLQSWEGLIVGLTAEGLNVGVGAGIAIIPMPSSEAVKFLAHLGKKVIFSVGLREEAKPS